MSWYIYSLLTSFSFVGMVLLVRLLTQKGFDPKQILLYLIGFAFLGFTVINLGSLPEVIKAGGSFAFLAILLFVGIVSILANWADFEAIKQAPNPGFPVAIRNTNVLPIALLSPLVFGSELTPIKFMGAVLVLVGIFLIIIEKSKLSQRNKNTFGWVKLAFIALAGFTISVMGQKAALRLGYPSQIVNFYNFGIVFIGYLILNIKSSGRNLLNKSKLKFFLPVVFAAGAFSFLANLLSLKGLLLAPNPGYHEAIKNSHVIFITILSFMIWHTKLDLRKFIGILVVTLGVVIIVI